MKFGPNKNIEQTKAIKVNSIKEMPLTLSKSKENVKTVSSTPNFSFRYISMHLPVSTCKDVAKEALEFFKLKQINSSSYSVYGEKDNNRYSLICLTDGNQVLSLGGGKSTKDINNLQSRILDKFQEIQQNQYSTASDLIGKTSYSISIMDNSLTNSQCVKQSEKAILKLGAFIPNSGTFSVFGERKDYNYAIVCGVDANKTSIVITGPLDNVINEEMKFVKAELGKI